MRSTSELLDMQTRGEDITPNRKNRVTTKRKNLGRGIMVKANDDPSAAYQYAMALLNDSVPRLQEYVLSHGETPAYDINNLVKQVYQIRMADVSEAERVFDFDTEDAITHLEDQEANFFTDNGYVMDEFLGELFAPVELAVAYMQNNNSNGLPDGYVDAGLLQGVINTVGSKIDRAALVRAAKGKKSGVLGFLSGGKREYDALVNYFKQNPAVAAKVLSGEITEESQLPNWKSVPSSGATNPLNKVVDDFKRDTFKQAIPYIVVFVIVIAVVVYFAARSKK